MQNLKKYVGRDLLELAKRYGITTYETGKQNKGWKGLVLNAGSKEIPIICDYDTWDTYVQFPSFKALTIAEASEMMEWMAGYDGKGNVLRRSPDDRTAWECTQKWYMNLIGLQNNSMARMKGKTT